MEEHKSFKVLEKGRLGKMEESNIIGGNLICTSKGSVHYCQSHNGDAYCPYKYVSCSSINDKLTCNMGGGYIGLPGSAGIVGNLGDDNTGVGF